MGFLSKLFNRKDDNNKTGGMEDYMQLVRVYFQASIAANVGITNLAMLPDLRVFKSTLHVQTVNNKLGLGEKSACRKMLKDIYGTLMKFKLRLPSIFKSALYKMTEKTVAELFTKNDYTDPAVLKAVVAIRQYNNRLGFSQKWISDFVYQVVMLAKKEPKPTDDQEAKK